MGAPAAAAAAAAAQELPCCRRHGRLQQLPSAASSVCADFIRRAACPMPADLLAQC